MSKVTVLCGHANGLQLRLYKSHEGLPDHSTVQLRGGSNQVDEAFMKAWVGENEGNDLLLNGTIRIPPPAQKAEINGEPGVDNIVERPEHESSIDAPASSDGKEVDAEAKLPG